MKFYMHIKYNVKVRYSEFQCNILINNKNRPIVCVIVIRYIGSI